MLAVTTFISTDIAAVPLLWVLPLALYLLTFVLAFSAAPRYPRKAVDRALPLLLLPLVLFLVMRIGGPIGLVVPLHVAVFFLAALVCHRALADDRPDAEHLTEFYLLVAAGGVLGSLFNTLIAPLAFTGIFEYPIVLVLVCLLREPERDTTIGRTWRTAAPLLAGVATIGILLATAKTDSLAIRFGLLGIPTFFCLSLSRTRLPFAAAIAALLFASTLQPDEQGTVLHAERTFFGAYKVRLESDGSYRTLTHGTTLHGVQSVDPLLAREPSSYYHASGPLGDIFSLVPSAATHPRVAVVGLGVGAALAYRRPLQEWTFYEIDPAVERIARREEFFTYLRDCGAACQVVIGDARQSLAAENTVYGMLVLDAFSSDAIPMHLVTREAFRLYLDRLAPGGVIAFHISNRHLNLEPVLARLAQEAQLVSMIRRDRIATTAASRKSSSDWLVIARASEDFGSLASHEGWRSSQTSPAVGVWTDDFSNILTLLLRR
jgi:spermidine synthase